MIKKAIKQNSLTPSRMPDFLRINLKLKEIRKAKKLKLKDIAEKVGVTISYIQQIENGTNLRAGLKTLNKICDVYGINKNDLMDIL